MSLFLNSKKGRKYFLQQSNTGKTVAMDYLVSKMVHILDAVVVFSKTEGATGNWGRRIPKLFLHFEFKPGNDLTSALFFFSSWLSYRGHTKSH